MMTSGEKLLIFVPSHFSEEDDPSDGENWNDVGGTKLSRKIPFLEVVFREEVQV